MLNAKTQSNKTLSPVELGAYQFNTKPTSGERSGSPSRGTSAKVSVNFVVKDFVRTFTTEFTEEVTEDTWRIFLNISFVKQPKIYHSARRIIVKRISLSESVSAKFACS